MKKIGIVGGTAWVSTVEYYAAICAIGEDAGVQPEFSIESIDNARAQAYIGSFNDEPSWERFDAYYRAALENVERAGAQVALLAANTPHHRFAAITAGIGIPVVSIIDAVARTCASLGQNRLLLLGTALTMSSSVMRARYGEHGIDVVTPPASEHPAIVALIERLQRGRDPRTGSIRSCTLGRFCSRSPYLVHSQRRSRFA